MPWLIAGPGFLAFTYFEKAKDIYRESGSSPEYLQASDLFEVFYNISFYGGIVIVFLEVVIFLLWLIWVIKSFRKKDLADQTLSRPWDMIFCPGIFIVGTLLLMGLIIGVTYGQGV